MMQMDKKGNWLPTKTFPCDCGSEGIVVAVEEDTDLDEFVGSPFINLAFWEFGSKLEKGFGLTKWDRIKYAFHILRGRSPWTSMVGLRSDVAKNLAHHILYLINKSKKSENKSKPLVDWPGVE